MTAFSLRLNIFFTFLQGSLNPKNYEPTPESPENNYQFSPDPRKLKAILPRSPKPMGAPSCRAYWIEPSLETVLLSAQNAHFSWYIRIFKV